MADAPTSGMPLPLGYSQQSLADYYKSLTIPIDQSTDMAVGQAKGNALARGLEGTPTETGGVAAAQYYGGLRKDSALGNLGFQMAGLSNQDALIKSQQNWQSNENSLNRTYGTNMEGMRENYGMNEMNTKNRFGYESGLANLAARFGGMGAGYAVGGPAGAMMMGRGMGGGGIF